MSNTTFSGPVRVGREADENIGTLIAAQYTTITVTDEGNDDASINIPIGSFITSIKTIRAAAITGSPTSVNLTVGTSAGDDTYVEAVDVKAAGVTEHLIVVNTTVTANAIYARLATTGGTTPGGPVIVVVEYIQAAI